MEDAPAEFIIADAAYGADHIRDAAAEQRAEAVIPNNPSRSLKHPLDKHLYAQRHVVECCISKLKQFVRVATRYEKTRFRLGRLIREIAGQGELEAAFERPLARAAQICSHEQRQRGYKLYSFTRPRSNASARARLVGRVDSDRP